MSALPVDADIDRMVVERVRQSGSSFFWAMRLMPEERRRAMYAIYAFCREVDDIADEPAPAEDKRRRLDAWAAAVDALAHGQSVTLPLARALAGPMRRFGLLPEDLIAIIDGCRMDGAGVMVRPGLDTLDLYCDRVASAVGRLSVRIFGDFTERCLDVAFHQGRALQLTNILRDVREDAGIGRLYLPDELLSKHGIEGREIPAILAHPALVGVCRELGGTARGHYVQARAAMADCSRRAMRPARVMLAMYEQILDRLERGGWRIDTAVHVPAATKVWCALRYGVL